MLSSARCDTQDRDGPPPSRLVLGMRVDGVEPPQALDRVLDLAGCARADARGRYVCAANVHMAMEAHDDRDFRRVVNDADLVVPDGQPMVWALRALGCRQRRRVRVSPDFLIDLLAAAEVLGLGVGLYGGADETLPAIVHLLEEAYPGLRIAYAWSPPFRALTTAEDVEAAAAITAARVDLLLVGIGCPKQERWMAAHATGDTTTGRPGLDCAMIGVGAAFDLFAGLTTEAPPWMQASGLEWLYRLALEPRRLWRRQIRSNPRFVALFLRQLVAETAQGRRFTQP